MGNITHFQSNHKKLQTGESWRSAEVGLHYSHFHQAEITQSAPGMSLNGFKPGPAEACSFLKSRLTVLCLGSEEPKTPNSNSDKSVAVLLISGLGYWCSILFLPTHLQRVSNRLSPFPYLQLILPMQEDHEVQFLALRYNSGRHHKKNLHRPTGTPNSMRYNLRTYDLIVKQKYSIWIFC